MATYRRVRDNFAGGDQRNNAGDDPYGDIFLVVDGWGTIRGEFDDLEATIADLANRGLSFGIHLVASANRWMEVRPNVRDVFGTRLELRLADPADSMVNRRVAMNVPERAPGRGITTDKLQFLSALPRIDGIASSTDVVDGLAALVKHVDDAWRGARAPQVRLLPELVSYQELQVDSTHRLPIGIAETDLGPLGLDLTIPTAFPAVRDSGVRQIELYPAGRAPLTD